MKDCGVLYLVWGRSMDAALERSIASVASIHPELPIRVHRLETGDLLDKASMAEVSPFRNTLFLDADTVVLDDLSFGFTQSEKHGLACCICECPWARRYPCCGGDAVEYNTGVLFFTGKAKPVFDEWNRIAREVDSSIRFHGPGGDVRTMPLNDQGGFAKSVHSLDFSPFVLPLNWNFRHSWHKSFFGPLKIWHDYRDPPRSLIDRNLQQSRPDAITDYAEFR